MGNITSQGDNYFLRRFLRARQHDLKRAKEMYAASMKWRAEFGVDTILDDFHFQERDAFISLYPQGYHKTDKFGRPIYIQHLGAINYKKLEAVTTEERMIKFHVQEYERCARVIMPACSLVAGHHIDQTFAIIDVKGVGLKHLTGEVKRMLSRIMSIDQNNYPEMLGHTCIINAPSIFKFVWQAIRSFIDPKTQEKVEVCPRDFVPALLKWVDAESLPEYLGGTSKATLLDDAGPWQDPKILAQVTCPAMLSAH
ncbi:CRAL/TRIO domain-containing protein [Coccomyxa subellipsoidea C-169]|uniref:CRAL/TRIO domain-containing protein n=1 Tax=Coccomyxa subellipsoidea (strain C-169) TaxID=574566 RepID=I0Z2W5_COCSC|nr:CRAL/TRIO domain-containing protein [Coccomyxa subellipsoidea C-169]EIE24984.1 CRAL/TRIO domain-containing protein [Coccomyxa subellipsoidea C-169]|eukprot:XP_005649528.1 CRAL/TRIO domain-containing protein [Coccomyxa subellipsoidea C-169]